MAQRDNTVLKCINLKKNNFLPLQSLVVYWEKHVNQGIIEIFLYL